MSAAFFGTVAAVSSNPKHTVSKIGRPSLRLIAGQGVDGDAHCGATVKHRSRARREPQLPNRRQVHLIGCELHDELRRAGFDIGAGVMGENITTLGIDLLALPTGSRLRIGSTAVIELTGLRNPCEQLNGIKPGLMKAVLSRDARGQLVRRAGVMAIVLAGGEIFPGNAIQVWLPAPPHRPLQMV